MTELPFKAEISSLLDNKLITSLLRDKYYKVDDKTELYLEGNLDFTLSMTNTSLVITMNNIKPKITYHVFKRGGMLGKVKVDGRLTFISISKDNITMGIDGMPDQVLKLV